MSLRTTLWRLLPSFASLSAMRAMRAIAVVAAVAGVAAVGAGFPNGPSAARAQELVPNPEFDVAAVEEWTGNVASRAWSQDESECLPPNASGSLLLMPENLDGPSSLYLCLVAPASGPLNLSFLVRPECEVVVKGKVRFHPEPGCGGVPGGSDEVGGTAPANSWEEASLFNMPLPSGTQSIWLSLELSQAISQICNTRFDKIHLGPGVALHRSGFETGSTACRWSTSP